jgi:hypothetical protein
MALPVLRSVDWYQVFMVAGCVLGWIMVLLNIVMLRRKLKARRALVTLLALDDKFLHTIDKMHLTRMLDHGDVSLTASEVTQLQRLVAKRIAELATEDQKLVAPPLQCSDTARARYIGLLAQEVDERIQQAA